MNQIFQQLYDAALKGEKKLAEKAAEEYLQTSGAEPLKAVNEALTPAMDEVGRLYDAGEYFLPELVGSAEAMKAALAVLRPAILSESGDGGGKGVVIMGTVEGDIHEIGKTIVATLLEANGFEVHDLGPNVKMDRLLAKVDELKPDIVGLSALLTTTMMNQRRAIELIRDKYNGTKVIVGGAPVTRNWAQQIGADGYGKDAFEAVKLVKTLLTE